MSVCILQAHSIWGIRQIMKKNKAEASRHVSVRLIPIFLGLLICSSAFASPEFGPLQGTTTIGASASLYTTLFGLSQEQLTQLQSGCLEATLQPSDISELSGISETQKLIVTFDRTVRTGGMLKMVSSQIVSEPSMSLSLTSFCPTVSFTKHWSVLFSPLNRDEALKQRENQARPTAQSEKQFKLANSSLLKASRRAPIVSKKPEIPEIHVEGETNPAPQTAAVLPTLSAQPSNNLNKQQTSLSNNQTVTNSPLNPNEGIVSTNSHLIQRSTIPDSPNAPTPRVSEQHDVNEIMSELPLWWLPLAGVVALLITIGCVYWYRQRNRRLIKLKDQTEPHFVSAAKSGAAHLSEISQELDADIIDSQNQTIPTHLFQSLMGVSTEDTAVEFDFSDERPRYDGTTSSTNPVDLALSSVNKDVLLPWVLPTGYQSIVEARNQLIQEKQEADIKYFKFALALIELCFQKLLQSEVIDADSIARVRLALSARDLDQFQDFSVTETVPDLIKSFVNEKILRLDDAQQRENMMAQLKTLGELCADLPLCFKSSAWAEFLFHLGQEASVS